MAEGGTGGRMTVFFLSALLILCISAGAYYFLALLPRHDQELRADISREIDEAWKSQDAIRRQADSAKITNIFLEQLEYKRLMDELSGNAADLVRRIIDIKQSAELYQKQFDDYRLSLKDSLDRGAAESHKRQQELSASVEALRARLGEVAEDGLRAAKRLDGLAQELKTFQEKQAGQARAAAQEARTRHAEVSQRLKALEEKAAAFSAQTEAPPAR